MSYKYNLHYHLRRLSVDDYQAAMKYLPVLCQVTRKTFREWIYRKEDESKDIPATALLKLAAFFALTPEELFSNPPAAEIINQDFEEFKSHVYSKERI